LLNPYQPAPHGRLRRCGPTSTRSLSRDEAFWFASNGSLRSGVPPDGSRRPLPNPGVEKDAKGRCIKEWAKSTCANLDGLSGILRRWKRLVRSATRFREPRLPMSGRSERNRDKRWFTFPVSRCLRAQPQQSQCRMSYSGAC
jgi:hypothetical protein